MDSRFEPQNRTQSKVAGLALRGHALAARAHPPRTELLAVSRLLSGTFEDWGRADHSTDPVLAASLRTRRSSSSILVSRAAFLFFNSVISVRFSSTIWFNP